MAEQTFQEGLLCIVMHERDNVATLLKDVNKGEVITYIKGSESFQVTLIQDIKFGHKAAIAPIRPNEVVMKYGEAIGAAIVEIPIGAHVHVHNLEGIRGRGDKQNASN
ncbi:UxaA family hydrolase [Neobacillus sp. NRS-1170]|uniref:UxaA family hydrolase n=1 Tax=Neobacillus sp. NRS-1170 TaxID=3233898 RepID=UPI003D26A2FF